MPDPIQKLKWFAVGADHKLHYVGRHSNSDEAYDTTEKILGDVPIVWLIDEIVAQHWRAVLEMVLDQRPIN